MTSQRVERTWFGTGGYRRIRGEWVNWHYKCQLFLQATVNSVSRPPLQKALDPPLYSLTVRHPDLQIRGQGLYGVESHTTVRNFLLFVILVIWK